MKTIYSVLPIYDRIEKQCFQRAKFVAGDKAVVAPVICPRHHLPAFQWNAESDNMGDVVDIVLVDASGYIFNAPTPFTGWTNNGWDISWSSDGLDFTASETAAHTANAEINGIYYGFAGENLNFHCVATISAGVPNLNVYENGALTGTYPIADGVNDIFHTLTVDGTHTGGGLTLIITSDNALAQELAIEQTRVGLQSFNKYFPALPAQVVEGTDTYYIYSGDTLNYLLPEGLYYLMIEMENGHILYSEWFLVTCVFENLISEWTNSTYNTFLSAGTAINDAEEAGADGRAYSDSFECINGEDITIVFFLTLVGGQLPTVRFTDGITDQDEVATAGLNIITFTAQSAGTHQIELINTAVTAFQSSEVWVMRQFSKDYIIIRFEHSCNLGDIIYETGFEPVVYLETEPMEAVFPYVERGSANGHDQFVPVWQRQDKNFIIRTNLVSQAMVDVLHRLKLHDTIYLTDLVGDISLVEEIEVEHTWQFDDKYYALAVMTVNTGEGIIVTGCCSAVNECH